MIRLKKSNKTTSICKNCKHQIKIKSDTIKEHTFDGIIATYIECPVCGEKILKQLDTEETQAIAAAGVKLEQIKRAGRIKKKQIAKLKSLEKELFNIRKGLNAEHWDRVHQQLNQ